MVLMNLNVWREVRVEIGFIEWTKAENEIALKIARIVEISSWSDNKMEL